MMGARKTKTATKNLFKKIFAVLKPPPNMTLSEWADAKRVLSKKTSAEPGRWKTSKAPYQREIMDAISDVSTPKVVVMSAAQIGKTDGFILNPIGYFMDYDPSPIMVMQPNLLLGESFSKDRLTPMLQDTPALRDKVSEKSKNSGNTILHKEFPGGHITIVGANSASGLRSRPIRVLLADEIDGYPPTAGKDGDPLLLASKRLTTFWNRKEVFISTPTVKGISRIEVEYENSTQEIWNVPCPQCGAYQPLEWGQVKFDKDDLSEIDYVCINCGAVSNEFEWKAEFEKGKFVAAYPERSVRGFYLNSLASNFVEWHDITEKFLVANEEKKKGNNEMLKVWTNTEMAQTWEEEGNEIDWETLYRRREKYGCEVPAGVLVLTAGVDTQDDRFEIEVVGWGYGRENWGIQCKIIYGNLQKQAIWNELSTFLNQTWTRADGAKMKVMLTCIDSGGHFSNGVYKFAKSNYPRVFAIKGSSRPDSEYIPRPSKNNREKAYLFTIGVNTGKALIYQALAVGEPGEGYCHFPSERDRGYTQEYFKGLTAERMEMTYTKGRAHYAWVLKKNGTKRNEPFDCRNYAQAALEIAGVNLEKKVEKATTGTKKKRRGVRSGGV